MTHAERSNLIFCARVAEKIERWKDMVKWMKDFVYLGSHLSPEDRAVFAAAYKSQVTSMRSHIQFLDSMMQYQQFKGNDNNVNALKVHRERVLQELKDVCDDAIDVINRRLFPSAQTFDDKVFYLSLEADFCRYFCEYSDAKDIWEHQNSAYEFYTKALTISKEHLMPVNPMVLNLIMNYTVFVDGVLNRKEEAIQEAADALKSVHKFIKRNGKDVVSEEAREIIGKIRANIDIWQKQKEEEV